MVLPNINNELKTIISADGDLPSLILWQQLQRDDDEAEAALHQLNPHLAALGPVLPRGIAIKLPQLVEKTPSKILNIWD
ncbi:tail protein X [uncultured Shewanella sp.]|uniref:tail protein X n=1 Tax=uncultured Shewanella sp. TaxID=173975 RepID=UPI002635439E|nr:tail protein X [uncultured Shewanella sp.]